MTEKLTEFPFLQVTPPLKLKEAGQPGKLPVLLSEGTAYHTQTHTVHTLMLFMFVLLSTIGSIGSASIAYSALFVH